MGLSRNKVAVSEGAAGSPPFYGDRDRFSRICHTSQDESRSTEAEYGTFVVQFTRIRGARALRSLKIRPMVWGCSSVGRAPALQAGGHGFESHHLHHTGEPGTREDGKNQHMRTVCSSGG